MNNSYKDSACGNFQVPCELGCTEIFNVIDHHKNKAKGSLTVFYQSGCAEKLMITIKDSNYCQKIYFIMKGSSRTFAIDDFIEIELTCVNGSSQMPCKGKYCLNYEIITKRKKYECKSDSACKRPKMHMNSK